MSFKKRAIHGVKWTSASAAITTALQFIQLSILSGMHISEKFCLMAMLIVIVSFVQAYADMGISNSITYRQDNA